VVKDKILSQTRIKQKLGVKEDRL